MVMQAVSFNKIDSTIQSHWAHPKILNVELFQPRYDLYYAYSIVFQKEVAVVFLDRI